MLITPDHDMIENLDAENVAGLHQSSSQLNIGSRRRSATIAGWVVVDDYNRCCRHHHGLFEEFSRMTNRRVRERADRASTIFITRFFVLRQTPEKCSRSRPTSRGPIVRQHLRGRDRVGRTSCTSSQSPTAQLDGASSLARLFGPTVPYSRATSANGEPPVQPSVARTVARRVHASSSVFLPRIAATSSTSDKRSMVAYFKMTPPETEKARPPKRPSPQVE